jgi:hypothetical protein
MEIVMYIYIFVTLLRKMFDIDIYFGHSAHAGLAFFHREKREEMADVFIFMP